MTEVSALIGKPILDLASSCIIGTVTDVYFDANLKNVAYISIGDTSRRDGEYLLEYSQILNFSDALTVKDDLKLLSVHDADVTSLQNEVLGRQVYLPSGAGKGNVRSIFLNSAGKVTKLQTEREEFTPASITAAREVILLKANVKTKNKNGKVKIPRPKQDYPVYILDETSKEQADAASETMIADAATSDVQTPTAPIPTPVTAQPAVTLNADSREPVLSNGAFEVLLDGSQAYSYDEDSHTPTRVICDYEFLLGRTLGADLCTYTGDLIAKQGSAITDFVVEQARRAGKLVELTLNSIKPDKSKL